MSYRHHLRVVLRVAEHGVNDLQHGGDASAAGHLQERQVTTDECGSKGGVGPREGRGTQAHGHNECDTGTGVRHRHRGTRGTTFARGTHVVGENKRR